MTLEQRLERLATRTPATDPADLLAAAEARAEAGAPPRPGPPRLLVAAAAVVAVVVLAAGAMALFGDGGGSADVATGPDTSAPGVVGQQEVASPTVRVEATGLPTVDVTTTPLRPSTATESGAWLDHTVTMENHRSDPVHLHPFQPEVELGDREVLAAAGGCVSLPGAPARLTCELDHWPVVIEPGGTYELDVTLWRGLEGMNPVTSGSYRWDIELDLGSGSGSPNDPFTPGGEVAILTLHYDGLGEVSDSGSEADVQGEIEVSGVPAAEGDTAVWDVDAADPPTRSASSLTVLVTRLGCNGGDTGEVLEPVVSSDGTQVILTFSVEPVPGGRCPGNNPVPYVVELGEQLGDRKLVDGACLSGEAVSTSVCSEGAVRWSPPS